MPTCTPNFFFITNAKVGLHGYLLSCFLISYIQLIPLENCYNYLCKSDIMYMLNQQLLSIVTNLLTCRFLMCVCYVLMNHLWCFRAHTGLEILREGSQTSDSLLKLLWHHSDAIVCCSLKARFRIYASLLHAFLTADHNICSFFMGPYSRHKNTSDRNVHSFAGFSCFYLLQSSWS